MLSNAEADPPKADHGRIRPDGAAPATIAATLDHDRNRQLLIEWLSAYHDVQNTTPAAIGEDTVDLFVLDPPGLERHAEALSGRVNDARPEFLPVLLVRPSTQAELPSAVWDLVDDVIETPVSRSELGARIEGLLDRRRLSRELRRSEDRFRTLVTLAPDPVFVLDGEDTIVTVNEAFSDLAGIPAPECIGKTLSTVLGIDAERFTADGWEWEDEPDTRSSAKGSHTIQYVGPTGVTTYLEVNRRTLRDHGDQVRIGVLRDVTERVERTMELARQNDRLEEFASTLSHELRNPLNIASGRLHDARAEIDDETFAQIESAHRRMAEMIDELLELARKGEVIDERAPVDIAAVAREAWDEFESDTATLVVDVPAETRVAADRDRLRDVLVNLFKNSVVHGGDGVTVRLELLPTGEGFAVEDDGQGFALDTPADALNPGVTTAAEGTGYGLSIVQQVVSAHGWTVTATESSNGGARFEVHGVDLSAG